MSHDTLDETFETDVPDDLTRDEATESDARKMDAVYEKARVARDKLNTLVNELGTKADHAEKRVRSGMAQTESRIKENPFAAVAVAAGLGLVVGLLLNRRH